jgi:hypothetical protein
VWLLPHFFIHSHVARLVNLAVTPVLVAGAVALLGRRRAGAAWGGAGGQVHLRWCLCLCDGRHALCHGQCGLSPTLGGGDEASDRHWRHLFPGQGPGRLRAWYQRHLGIDVQPWGGAAFDWTDAAGQPVAGTTAWSIGPQGSEQFAPGTAPSW